MQEVVSKAFLHANVSSNHVLHFLVKGPSPDSFWFDSTCFIYSISFPVISGILKGIFINNQTFRPTRSNEPPKGNDTPDLINNLSNLKILYMTLFKSGFILSSSPGS